MMCGGVRFIVTESNVRVLVKPQELVLFFAWRPNPTLLNQAARFSSPMVLQCTTSSNAAGQDLLILTLTWIHWKLIA